MSSKKFSGKLFCKISELDLNLTLLGGQSFRWTCDESTPPKFTGVAYNHLWELTNSQSEDSLSYTVYSKHGEPKHQKSEEYYSQLLSKYFRLNFNLEDNFDKWKAAHKHFEETSSVIKAVRVLDQEPLENVISFICSQNNHIKRISTMVEWLCSRYGEKISTLNGVDHFSFPTLEALYESENLEENLRKAKFGYRAKFIAGTVRKIQESGGMNWFAKLKDLPYEEARKELVTLPGIGFKVADCICLMSLNHLESVPIDTHIYKIAQNSYLPHLKKTNSVTPKIYDEVSAKFREIYGEYAGWAQAVLFCSGLQRFKGDKSASEGNEPEKKKKRRK